MRNAMPGTLTRVVIALLLSASSIAWAQGRRATTDQDNASSNGALFVAGQPFSAVKYAHQVKILPNGKQQFIRNERYPTQIARDADGRVMMQIVQTDHLVDECDHLEMLVPPVCPDWSVFVVDPVAQTDTHWPEGERAGHIVIDFPLSRNRLEEAAHATGDLPDVPPNFSDEDGEVSTADLGDKTVEGVQAHGVRTTLRYTKNESGAPIHVTRIHEVWIAPEMRLIIRVVDGDPNGVETVWGLEKISLSPEAALFQPPPDYEWQHGKLDKYIVHDFECLESWFTK